MPDLWHLEQSVQILLQQNRLDPGLKLLLGEFFGMKMTVGRDTVDPCGMIAVMFQSGACYSK